jgi:hypothetical protein
VVSNFKTKGHQALLFIAKHNMSYRSNQTLLGLLAFNQKHTEQETSPPLNPGNSLKQLKNTQATKPASSFNSYIPVTRSKVKTTTDTELPQETTQAPQAELLLTIYLVTPSLPPSSVFLSSTPSITLQIPQQWSAMEKT